MAVMERTGMLLIISGPSGTGKGTLVNMLMAQDPSFRFSCSVTTRKPRVGEVDGVHYYFVSDEEYDRMVENNEFLEHATVHANRYGTLRKQVEDLMKQGYNVLLDIDPQGAISVMENTSDYVSVFILPPSFTALRERLQNRNTEAPADVERRLNNARGEVEKLGRYQYALINDNLEDAFQQLQHIVNAEKLRTNRYNPIISE